MIALALDTSHSKGSMALAIDGTLAGTTTFGSERAHLLEISKSLNNLALRANINLKDIDRLVLVSGPGSFTGLRVGMSFAKGLYAAMRLGIATVDTLRALAMPLLGRGVPVVSMVNARRNEAYVAVYAEGADNNPRSPGELVSPKVESPEVFLHDVVNDVEITAKERIIFVGSGAIICSQLINSIFKDRVKVERADDWLPSTKFLAAIAESIPVVPLCDVQHLEPIYIRPSDAELKKLREVGGE